MIPSLLILFVIAILAAIGLVAYIVYTYFEIVEKFNEKTPDQIFMEAYREARKERLSKYKV